MRNIRFVAASLAVLAAAACSSDTSPTGGTPNGDDFVTADMAVVTADAMSDDIDMMAGMDGTTGNLVVSGAAILMPPGSHPRLKDCVFADGSFTCPPFDRNGLTVVRVITLYDANGNTQSAYDPLTTASIHVVADINGDVTRDRWSSSVSRHRDFTITGLAGTETTRTVNGTGHGSSSRTRTSEGGETRSYDLSSVGTATDVVFPVRSEDGGSTWPISGTVTRVVTITYTSGPRQGTTTTRTITITFNGTSSVDADINGVPYTFDLETRTATPKR